MITLLWITSAITILWIALTILVQRKGAEHTVVYGNKASAQKALIVYNPDLFYNMDEQLCESFAKGLTEKGWYAQVSTVSAAEKKGDGSFDLYMFCANTYNWAPDLPTRNFIRNHDFLVGSNVIAITLGSGSTQRAQRVLEETIVNREAKLLHSEVFWLMRPNDDTRSEEPNVQVALEKAHALGKKMAHSLKNE